MQYKIPQNVQVEDKIIGPLSMKDLGICAVGGGVGYVAYIQLDNETWPFITIPSALITLAIIFVKINGMTFTEWLHSLIIYLTKPAKRVHRPMSNDSYLLDVILNPPHATQKTHTDNQEKLKEKKEQTYKNLSNITNMIDDAHDDQLVQVSFDVHKK